MLVVNPVQVNQLIQSQCCFCFRLYIQKTNGKQYFISCCHGKSKMSIHQPFTFANGVSIKNRITLAPMTNCQSHLTGEVGKEEQDWLVERAKGGFGIIFTCAAHICKSGQGWSEELGIFDDSHIPGLTKLASAIRENGSLSIIQLFHGGTRAPSAVTGHQPVSASVYQDVTPDFETPRALCISGIRDIINKFVSATKRAHKAGFDGVELHGANGYLITQFLNPHSNTRMDEYGGGIENRARFGREILRECRKVVPKEFLVGYRLLPDSRNGLYKITIDETIKVSMWFRDDGADFIHLSALDAFKMREDDPNKPLITAFRDNLGDFPIMIAGKIRTVQDAEDIIAMGATFVALGTIAIGNPDWPNRSLQDKDYMPVMPPFRKDLLMKAKVSPVFYDYLTRRFGGMLQLDN